MCCCVIIIESTNQIAENISRISTIGEGSEPIIIPLEGRRATPKRKVGFFELQKSQTSPLVDGCVHLMLLATAREYRDRGSKQYIRRIRRSVGRGYVYGVLCVGEGSDRRSMVVGLPRAQLVLRCARTLASRRLLLQARALRIAHVTFRGAARPGSRVKFVHAQCARGGLGRTHK